MSSSPLNLVSEHEYLHTTYRPDCDYVDGFVLDRNLGQFDHSMLQMLVLVALHARAQEWNVLVMPELRLKIRPRKYRIPDIMVLDADAPRTPVIEHAPLLCIEIVSPDDRMSDLVMRAGDYLDCGVPETWILDPENKRSYIYDQDGLRESHDAVLRQARIELPVAEIFASRNFA
jgi:Uma2 family endonuclease